jgi:hypothetical protein
LPRDDSSGFHPLSPSRIILWEVTITNTERRLDHRGERHDDRIESDANGGLADVDIAVRYVKRFV